MVQLTFRRMCRANRFAYIAVLVISTAMADLAADSSLEIDFRSVRVRPLALDTVGGRGAGGGIGGTGKAIAPPLTVTVVDTESAACNNAQRYANVRLVNNSSNPVVLPWTPDGSEIIPAKDAEDQVSFEILNVTLRSKKNPDQFVTRELFGRVSVPTSRASLLPGQSAFLRNIALPHRKDTLCGPDIVAEIGLSLDQAIKSGNGYSLSSQEKWRVQSE